MNRALCVFLFFLLNALGFAQKPEEKKKFVIEVAGIKVGETNAIKKTNKDGIIHIKSISKVKVNFLVYQLKIEYEVISEFDSKGLVYSEANAKTNKGDYQTITKRIGDYYQVFSLKGKIDKKINNPIFYTSNTLFFEKPEPNSYFFAEYYGIFSPLSTNKDGSYSSRVAKNSDKYIFRNNELIQIIKQNPIKNAIMRLEN